MYGKTNSVVIKSDSQNTLKKLLDATKSTAYLFYKYSGTSVDDLIQYDDTENVTNVESMFGQCNNITSIPLLNTSNVKNMNYVFQYCSNLINIPLFDTSMVEYMNYAFQYCTALKVVPALILNNNLKSAYDPFKNCNNLEEIHIIGLSFDFKISYSTKFTREALVEILNNLATVTTTKTLTMGATNLAKLTDEDKLIATNKGWTLA